MKNLFVLATAMGAALSSCASNPVAGDNGTDSLIASTSEPAGDNCENGGTRLDFGPDSNANGVLDADEVESTQYACNEPDGSDGADGSDGDAFQTLVLTTDEPAGGNCADGGQRVDVGIDDNGNGLLEAAELDDTTFICNGATGGDTLIASSAEAAGVNCASGGTRLDHGVDDTHDGILDPGEIDGTFFVCNGVSGITGLVALVTTTSEAAGVNCVGGGQRVDQGFDDSADGVLDAAEIDSTSFVCNAAAGANGFDTLVLVSAEAAGANCVTGGARIRSGTDTSDDGVLDAGEVTATSFACNGLRSLVFTSAVAAGGACGTGAGNQVDIGLDSNNDGALQAGEVTTSALACGGAPGANGADGFDVLVRQTAIAAGGVCGAASGVQVDSGLDLDRSGALDAGEVSASNNLCNGLNGANGAPGLDGATGRVLLTAEPAGANCAEGGTRVDSGLDTDLSGALEAGEITSTQFACNGGVIAPNLLVNGSFESGDFGGWTIDQFSFGSPNPNNAHVIVGDGVTINEFDTLFDSFDGVDETVNWCGGLGPTPQFTYNSSEGTQSAVLFAAQPGNMRMFQDVDILPGTTTLSFDMRYENVSGGWAAETVPQSDGQEIVVRVRNPADDSIVATVFQAADPLPFTTPALATFTADVSAFVGQTVRIDFVVNTFNFCQWYQFDNIVIN